MQSELRSYSGPQEVLYSTDTICLLLKGEAGVFSGHSTFLIVDIMYILSEGMPVPLRVLDIYLYRSGSQPGPGSVIGGSFMGEPPVLRFRPLTLSVGVNAGCQRINLRHARSVLCGRG